MEPPWHTPSACAQGYKWDVTVLRNHDIIVVDSGELTTIDTFF
jgi:hypothetical protein